MKVDVEVFYRARFERGLKVSPKADFSNPRLKEIAEEQDKLFNRLDELDAEIEQMRKNENPS